MKQVTTLRGDRARRMEDSRIRSTLGLLRPFHMGSSGNRYWVNVICRPYTDRGETDGDQRSAADVALAIRVHQLLGMLAAVEPAVSIQ